MKSLKLNLSSENLIVNKMFPSMAMCKCMKDMFCKCCMFVMACCCCIMNKMDMACKMINENLRWINYRATVLFMKYFVGNFMESTVVFYA